MPVRAAACAGRLAHHLPLLNVTPISNKGHIMKKASTLIIAAAAFLPLAALAQTPPAPPADASAQPPQQGGTTFESLDTNSDGKISKAEAEANANVKAQFSTYDINGDGFIERDEVGTANKSKEQTPQQ
jgi:EF hand domain-containing protein